MNKNKYTQGLLSGLGSGLLLALIISDFFYTEKNGTLVIVILATVSYISSWYFGRKE